MLRTQWNMWLVLLCASAFCVGPAGAQVQPPTGLGMGQPGMGIVMVGGPGMMPPMPQSPPVTMMIADGVVYIACNGVLTAYEAKTLKQLGQATYGQPPPPPAWPMGPGGPPPAPAGPPPAAP